MSEHRTPSIPRCGEIWTCHLGEHGPGVQSGYRPVLILSNDQNNLFSSVVNVAPLTSKMHKRSLPVHVELWDYETYGLKSPSTILIEQTTTIQMNCLDFRVGKIHDKEIMEQIWLAIEVQFAIRKDPVYPKAS